MPNIVCAQVQPLDISYGWTMSYEGKSKKDLPINTLWRHLDISTDDELEVTYHKEFELGEQLKDMNLIFIMPNTWVPKQIFINGTNFTALKGEGGAGSYIYRKKILRVSSSLMKQKNHIKIIAYGNKYLGGFRTNDFMLRPESKGVVDIKANQFLYNDIHFGFLVLSLIIGTICLFVSLNVSIDRPKNLAIAVASFSLIPYHLLTTNFYGLLFENPTTPFRLQLVFQALTWLAWAYYLTLALGKKSFFARLGSKKTLIGISIYMAVVTGASLTAPFMIFQALLMPAFVLPAIIIIPWWMSLSNESPVITTASGIAIVLAYATLASDVLALNYYFSGYSVTIFTSISLFFFLKNYMKAAIGLKSVSGFIDHLLPEPVVHRIEDLLEEGSDLEQIREKIRGDRVVSTVFVDICSFGEMTAQVSSTIVYETRTYVFERLADILTPHKLFFIKPMGDSAHFCGGLNRETETQTEIATNCLLGVIDVLDNIDTINLELQEKDLPSVEVKVSATLGHAEFGLEGTRENLRFDVQGHWINMAKRLEDAMDSNFYTAHGRNCALVSENIFKFCKDIHLQERFPTKHSVSDKHSIVISAYVGQQYPDQISREDALSAIYGQFAHKKKKAS